MSSARVATLTSHLPRPPSPARGSWQQGEAQLRSASVCLPSQTHNHSTRCQEGTRTRTRGPSLKSEAASGPGWGAQYLSPPSFWLQERKPFPGKSRWFHSVVVPGLLPLPGAVLYPKEPCLPKGPCDRPQRCQLGTLTFTGTQLQFSQTTKLIHYNLILLLFLLFHKGDTMRA